MELDHPIIRARHHSEIYNSVFTRASCKNRNIYLGEILAFEKDSYMPCRTCGAMARTSSRTCKWLLSPFKKNEHCKCTALAGLLKQSRTGTGNGLERRATVCSVIRSVCIIRLYCKRDWPGLYLIYFIFYEKGETEFKQPNNTGTGRGTGRTREGIGNIKEPRSESEFKMSSA
jgi:hypothetical protein